LRSGSSVPGGDGWKVGKGDEEIAGNETSMQIWRGKEEEEKKEDREGGGGRSKVQKEQLTESLINDGTSDCSH
jgi:hypothetical protein